MRKRVTVSSGERNGALGVSVALRATVEWALRDSAASTSSVSRRVRRGLLTPLSYGARPATRRGTTYTRGFWDFAGAGAGHPHGERKEVPASTGSILRFVSHPRIHMGTINRSSLTRIEL